MAKGKAFESATHEIRKAPRGLQRFTVTLSSVGTALLTLDAKDEWDARERVEDLVRDEGWRRRIADEVAGDSASRVAGSPSCLEIECVEEGDFGIGIDVGAPAPATPARGVASLAPVAVRLVDHSAGGESEFFSYECENGGRVLVEVESGGFPTIREEPSDGRCAECCVLSGGWDGSLIARAVRPCWKAPRS